MTWRIWAIIILMTLSIIDLGATTYYIQKYKAWQPEKPYKMMERNPLLVFLWNNLGFVFGTIVGAVIILTLVYLVAKTAHPIIVGLLFLFLLFALYNHYINLGLLDKLIDKFPSGHLPEKIFGKVVGNNLK